VPDELTAIVVVPARDEAARIADCIEALAAQTIGPAAFSVIVVLDDCHDDTGSVAVRAAHRCRLTLETIQGPGRGAGPARRMGMDRACERLLAAGRADGLVACTDADSRPALDWLERQLAHLESGAGTVAGRIELDPAEAARLPAGVVKRRAREAAARLERVRRREPGADHHHFAGASIGVRADAYRALGGIRPLTALEDADFAERAIASRVPLVRADDVVVMTSARSEGRVSHGLSADLALAAWHTRRRFDARAFTLERLAELKTDVTVTVIVPVRECAETVAGVLERTIGPSRAHGLVDDVVVVDAASRDGSARIARAAGARVLQQDELDSELGPALGKGDAMWRALRATGGDLVCFLDGDTLDPDPAHLQGLLGPLLADPSIQLVKGAFDRPFDGGTATLQHEGGRVTELMARPLINLREPRLAGFAQPLAGEFAARRGSLEAIPFPVGYGVEIAILIDLCRRCGLDALAECRMGTRQNRHQPLAALGEMASAVLEAVDRRCGGAPSDGWPEPERPPAAVSRA
jgi:glucosyl-3-phosphoglycerate synthase